MKPFRFLPLQFVVTVTNAYSWLTVYAILYMADLPVARSLVWNIRTIGILMIVAGLFLR